MSRKVKFCSVCGIPAPSKPRRAGWLVRGHNRMVCPDCQAEAKLALNAKAQGGRPGAFRHKHQFAWYSNNSIADANCQENSRMLSCDPSGFVAYAEHQFAEGARRVRLV